MLKHKYEECSCDNGLTYDENDVCYDCEKCGGDGFFTLPVDENEKVWVNVYYVTRHYGGPEEGSWYWNRYSCVEVVPCKNKYADEIKADLIKEYEHEKYGNIYSVLGGRDVEVNIEESRAKSETKETPQYS